MTCATFSCLNPLLDEDAVARCESYCIEKLDASVEQGQMCEEAFAEAMTCLADLSCSEYEEWAANVPDAPCSLARPSVEEACEQIYLEPHALPP